MHSPLMLLQQYSGMQGNNGRLHARAPYDVAEAYIQPTPYRTDETVKSDLNRLMLLVDDTQIPIAGQSYVRYPLWWPTARPLAIVDQTVDHFTPVAGTRMRQ